jgi:hypothetical protein
MTFKEELAEILEVFDDIAYRPNEYDFEKAQVQIIEAFNKILPEGLPVMKILSGSTLKETNHQIKGFNQCVDQIKDKLV